jgi:hypothetical protein
MDSDDKFAITTLIVCCATLIGLVVLLVSCGNDINAEIEASKQTQDAPVQVEHANGCPLDAVVYDAPAFSGEPCYKVVDRTSGAQWWMVKMGKEWVALPLPIAGKEADVG